MRFPWFISIVQACLAASKILSQQLLASLKLVLDTEDSLCSYAAKNHGYEWGLICFKIRDIYKSILTWTHSKKSKLAVEATRLNIFPWNIPWRLQRLTESAQEHSNHVGYEGTSHMKNKTTISQ